MKMKTCLWLVGILLISPLNGFSKEKTSLSFTEKIASYFSTQSKTLAQEKIYIQTDKPYYNGGETIWLKGYVLNATTHKMTNKSNYMYVELIDRSDSVRYRMKIRKDSLGYGGYIDLKPEIPAGNYCLRAYTYWMQNVASDFFFKKNIYIGNSINTSTQSLIKYGPIQNGNVPVTISLLNENKNPNVGQKVIIELKGAKGILKKMTSTSNIDGTISFSIPLNASTPIPRSIYLHIDEENLKYENSFQLPDFSSDFDLQFFPESGILLTNAVQSVAFKAIGVNGLSVEVSGKLFTTNGTEVAEFSSFNKGMGKFAFNPEPTEKYYAIVTSAQGVEKRFSLPIAQTNGISMHFAFNKDRMVYEVTNQTQLPTQSLFLLAHSRGQLYILKSLNSASGQIAAASLPTGIISFSVIDSLGNTYCERLCFANDNKPTIIQVQSNKQMYDNRDSVMLNFDIRSTLGNPIKGNFSISVTDNSTVKHDSLGDNILSNLLLTSDIKGYIESPGSYFLDNSNLTREKLDVLLMTQGWRRFNTADVIKGKNSVPKYYIEAGQAISGKVLNLVNKPSKKCSVILLSPYKSIFKTTLTDSLGRFQIDGIEFPDSTVFVLKAKKQKSITDVEILIDKDEFPTSKVFIPILRENTTATPLEEYLRQSRDKYFTEGGMRVYALSGVTVSAKKISTTVDEKYYSGLADAEIDSAKLSNSSNQNILTLLSSIAGVMVIGNQISIRGSMGQPTILLDDIECQSIDEIEYLTGNDLENISVFKGANAAIFGSKGGNGVISITLKKGVVNHSNMPPSIAHIAPLGYQKPCAFYVPKYNIDSVRMDTRPDLRTTIYWNPALNTDANGKANVAFYTADKSGNYDIVVEGVSEEGEICRFVGVLQNRRKADKKSSITPTN